MWNWKRRDRSHLVTLKYQYQAAFYRTDDWYVVSLLDFPGVNTQGKTLKEARDMVKDALTLMVECYLEDSKPLPKPNPKAKDKDADFHEKVALEIRARASAKS
jgi:predicted RNase H-like HicB family nuclease